ncbi:MAG: hypothetical protein ABI429_05425 [Jatrophihabitantaceae bacterium]
MPTRPLRGSVPKLALSAMTIAAAGLCLAAPAIAGPTHDGGRGTTGPQVLAAHTILNAASHGWTQPDDLTSVGRDLYVGFQNGVPSTGGTTGTPTWSTIVKLRLDGSIEHSWQIVGKCDGLTADPAHDRLIATVNEDGNSSLYTIPTRGTGAPRHYTYDASPLPHGGGTDSITIEHGKIYIAVSAPTDAGPALYQIVLHGRTAHLAAAPFYDSSSATIANPGSHPQTNLALTDPDSSTLVPRQSPRFGGDFMLDSQGDQQAVFAAHVGRDNQQLQVLNLSQSVDDTAFATSSDGLLVTNDSTADSVVVISGRFVPGRAYTAVTPGNANSAPANPGPNYLGSIDLRTGNVSPVTTSMPSLQPHGLIYLPGHRR